MKVTVIKQYSVFLPNRPGSLAGLTGLFAEAGVNIIGIASEVRDDSGMVRLAVDGDGDHSGVLSRAGFASVESRLLSLEITDEPGRLADVARRLAEGGVNVTTVYGTSFRDRVSRLLIAVENTDKALEILTRDPAVVVAA